MTALTVRAALPDGREVTLDRLTEVEVSASLSSPARAMRCTAVFPGTPGSPFPGELGAVRVEQGNMVLFTGKTDRQTASLSAAGRLLRLEARSKGARLLDNEALPCALENVRLATVFDLFAAPHGFAMAEADPGHALALYAVNKGQTEWEALCGFTRRAYGRTPYVTGDTVSLYRPQSAFPLLIGGEGHAFTKLERALEPYHIVSKVVLRDLDGAYSAAVHNPAAALRGITRKRYLIPPGEFTDYAALDANQRIRRSMLDAETVTAVLPGIVDASPGQEARILDEALPVSSLLAEEVTWRQSAAGVVTELKLVNSLYYD